MRQFKAILFCLILAGLPLIGFSAETSVPTGAATSVAVERAEEGIPPNAGEVARIGSFPITNSMVVTWIVALALIIFAQIATRKMKEIPDGAQNFWEWMVESLYNFLEGIIGHSLVKKTFWFFATIFIFIIFCNWAGLIPGFGTMGWGIKHRTVLK